MSVPPTPIEVFYSYALEDETLRNKLEKHLGSLQRQGLIYSWHNQQSLPGADWAKDIDAHLETAKVILLLISVDFIHSNQCYNIEMKRALERQQAKKAHVIPILLRPVVWKGESFKHLKMLPTNSIPITEWPNEDSAFTNVANGIIRLLQGEPLEGGKLPEAVKLLETVKLPERGKTPRLLKARPSHYVLGILPVLLLITSLIMWNYYRSVISFSHLINTSTSIVSAKSTATLFNSLSPSPQATSSLTAQATSVPALIPTSTSASIATSTPAPVSASTPIPISAQKTSSSSPLSPEERLSKAEAGTIVYQNQLNSNQGGWDTGSTPNPNNQNQLFTGTCIFTSAGYDVNVSNGSTTQSNPSYCENNQLYGDVLIEVDVRITQGNAGLLFRIQDSNRWTYYFFEINPSAQTFDLYIKTDIPPNPYTSLINPQPFPQGIQGNTHTLQVITQGSTFYLYIDGKFVEQVIDRTFASGSIGFVCYNNLGSRNGDALFSNLIIRYLPANLT